MYNSNANLKRFVICLILVGPLSADAFTLFDAGGFQGYTYNKWGTPVLGDGAVITWSLLPAGTMGSGYCGDACTGTSTTMLNVWDAGSNTFVMTDLSDLSVVLQQAMAAWSRVANVTFVGPMTDIGLPVNDPNAKPPMAGDIRIGSFDFTNSVLFAGAVGYAPPPNGGTGEGDVFFNSTNFFQLATGTEGDTFDLFPPGGGPFMNDVGGLFLHELGHALGLDHPDNLPPGECSAMSIDPNCFDILNHEPDRDDIMGIRTLYSFNPDLSGDGQLSTDDIDLLTASIAANNYDPFFDLDADGLVSLSDRDAWLATAGAAMLPSGNAFLLGDANLDGVVDGVDFIAWNSNKFSLNDSWSAGDFDADGVVDGSDFIAWNANKFRAASTSLVVPEPTSVVVLIVSMGILHCPRNRQYAVSCI